MPQPSFFDDAAEKSGTSSTFQGNLSLPVHRWFRYSAGFSARWVRNLIEREKAEGRHRILDPFVGSGTVVLEAERAHADTIGIEARAIASLDP